MFSHWPRLQTDGDCHVVRPSALVVSQLGSALVPPGDVLRPSPAENPDSAFQSRLATLETTVSAPPKTFAGCPGLCSSPSSARRARFVEQVFRFAAWTTGLWRLRLPASFCARAALPNFGRPFHGHCLW